MDVSCRKLFLPGTSLEPAVIPTAHASSFTLQYFPHYVRCYKCSCLYNYYIIIIVLNNFEKYGPTANP